MHVTSQVRAFHNSIIYIRQVYVQKVWKGALKASSLLDQYASILRWVFTTFTYLQRRDSTLDLVRPRWVKNLFQHHNCHTQNWQQQISREKNTQYSQCSGNMYHRQKYRTCIIQLEIFMESGLQICHFEIYHDISTFPDIEYRTTSLWKKNKTRVLLGRISHWNTTHWREATNTIHMGNTTNV